MLSCFNCWKQKSLRIDDTQGGVVVSMTAMTTLSETLISTASEATLARASALANTIAASGKTKYLPFLEDSFKTESFNIRVQQAGNLFSTTITSLEDPSKFVQVKSRLNINSNLPSVSAMIAKNEYAHEVVGTNMNIDQISACFNEVCEAKNTQKARKRGSFLGL